MNALPIRDLLERPGGTRRIDIAEPVEHLRNELVTLPAGECVRVTALLERIVEGVLVTGTLSGPLALRCARCLMTFEGTFEVEVTELFSSHPEEDEYQLGEHDIDLEPMVRDAVLLAMPFSPICREDCQGLCTRCGGDRNLSECTCVELTDPRWAALGDIEFDSISE